MSEGRLTKTVHELHVEDRRSGGRPSGSLLDGVKDDVNHVIDGAEG